MKKQHKILIIILLLLGLSNLSFAQCSPGGGNQDKPAPIEQPPSHEDGVEVPSLNSCEPNEIVGTEGYDSLHWVSVNQVLAYTVYFENDPVIATAAAQWVEVRLPLHPNVDKNSFGLGNFGWGDFRFEINNRPPFYQQRLDMRDSLGFFVDLTAGIDIVTQEAFWMFQTIDPATGLPPVGVQDGFLPVNIPELNNGVGFVNYFIKPSAACVTGDTITAQAFNVFDLNEPVPTNIWKNTIDAVAPQSTLTATVLPTEVEFSFTAQDDPEGCGVKEIQLYVAMNEEQYEQVGTFPIDTTIYYPYISGNTYRFYTSALDNVRNKEEFKPVPDFILNENLPPTDIRLSNNTFYNYEEQGATIGVLSTVDKISNQTFIYELVSGTGSTDNAMFNIADDRLVVNHNFYCLPDNNYSIRVRTTNESTLSYEKAFTLQLLSTLEPDTTRISETICQGETHNFYGETLISEGIYNHTLTTINACDSVIQLTLIVNSTYSTPLTASICDGDSYSFYGQTLTTGGVYEKHFETIHGCDSAFVLTLTVNPIYTTPITATISEGDSYTFFGETLTEGGTYYHTLQSVHECDSIIQLTLTVNAGFTPVSDITGVPTTATAGYPLVLFGAVLPPNATSQTIVWSISATDDGSTGATISGNALSATAAGTATVTATIANGLGIGTPFTKDFPITVSIFAGCPDLIGYQGYNYQVIELAGKCWTENMRVRYYNDGDPVPFARAYYCTQCPDSTGVADIFGLLYTWESAVRETRALPPQGICPNGWHVPTKAELDLLNNYAIDELKSKPYWITPGTDDYTFTALPAGIFKGSTDRFIDLYGATGFWSSDSQSNLQAYCIYLNYYCNFIMDDMAPKQDGLSVRCVMND
jgi:uncharacterized protein (TIGR02145 family)